MGWPPAVVIVVRHGARLDAADKQWHLTSPTPYDPPLTYGGFTQSKTLGARIASILRSRETDDEADGVYKNGGQDHPDGNTRKRRHKVVIHTSPFLRCVQTSVGIAAGLAQNPGHMHRSSSKNLSSSRSRPSLATSSPALEPISEPVALKPAKPEIRKSTIRVDAFLGEWLSPDYFEQITPPPNSVMMVASAKSDLLRREDYSHLSHTQSAPSASANKGFPGGWKSPTVEENEFLLSMTSIHHALPRRDRTSSLSSSGHCGTGAHGSIAQRPGPSPLIAEHGVYQPPIPSYAISSVDPIPAGYVAHARDACVDVDYQWDSMRAPQNWGNGGDYGEEWSSMHKRFRKGLQNLVSWYSEEALPFEIGLKSRSRSNSGEKISGLSNLSGQNKEEGEDNDVDLVIILVTHGAGCNALIGALTNQPVLIDVGMASLTMAVRKTVFSPKSSPSTSPPQSPTYHSRVGAKVPGISDEYDVKLVANTEHLRPAHSISRGNSLGAGSGNATVGIGNRYPSPLPHVSGNPFESGVSFGQPVNSNRNYISSSSSSLRRSTSNSSPSALRNTFTVSSNRTTHGNGSGHRSGSIGLWSAPGSSDTATMTVEDDVVLNFGDGDSVEKQPDVENEKETKTLTLQRPETPKNPLKARVDGSSDSIAVQEGEEEDVVRPLTGTTNNSALGLWGSPRPPGEAERIRESGVQKRRWTVSEN